MRRRPSPQAVSWRIGATPTLLVLGVIFPLSGCIYIAPSPSPPPSSTIIVRPGPVVVCSNGLPATYSNGVYRC